MDDGPPNGVRYYADAKRKLRGRKEDIEGGIEGGIEDGIEGGIESGIEGGIEGGIERYIEVEHERDILGNN